MTQNEFDVEQQKKRRSNIILAIIIGSVAVIGFVWPLVILVD